MEDELLFVQNCWRDCLLNPHEVIPAFQIKVDDCFGNTSTIKLNTLNYYANNSSFDITDNFGLNVDSETSVDTDSININIECEANMSKVFDKIMSTPKVDRHFTPSMNVSLNENQLSNNNKIQDVDSRLAMSADSFDSSIHFESSTDLTQDQIEINETNDTEDVVAQIVPVILSDSSGNNDTTVSTLFKILGKHDLIEQYKKIKNKYEKHHVDMYYNDYLDSVAKLEVLLNCQRDILKKEIGDIQGRKLEKNCASLDLIPTSGADKVKYDEIINKLTEIQVLKATLNNFK